MTTNVDEYMAFSRKGLRPAAIDTGVVVGRCGSQLANSGEGL